jgi:transcriptional regulator with XRE-family HTH domain
VVIIDAAELPVYLRIGDKAKQLRELGMSDRAIARTLGISDKTVAKASRSLPLTPAQDGRY